MAITRLGGDECNIRTIPQGNIANASLGAVTALPAAISTGKVLQHVKASSGSFDASSGDLDVTSTTVTDTEEPVSITSTSFVSVVLGNGFVTYGAVLCSVTHFYFGFSLLLDKWFSI